MHEMMNIICVSGNEHMHTFQFTFNADSMNNFNIIFLGYLYMQGVI